MDRQRAFANHPGPIKDYFKKLQAVIAKYQIRDENMWNMDEKGFILGKANRAKVMARAGRQPPRTTHDGTRELITAIEACGAKQGMLPPMVVFKGTAHYRGWYTEVTEETHAYFAYSPKGYTTDEIRLQWLQKFDAQTRTELAGPPLEYRPPTPDGHRSHHNPRFREYAWETRLSYYPTQATQHTYCNLLMWDCFHHYKKRMEMQ